MRTFPVFLLVWENNFGCATGSSRHETFTWKLQLFAFSKVESISTHTDHSNLTYILGSNKYKYIPIPNTLPLHLISTISTSAWTQLKLQDVPHRNGTNASICAAHLLLPKSIAVMNHLTIRRLMILTKNHFTMMTQLLVVLMMILNLSKRLDMMTVPSLLVHLFWITTVFQICVLPWTKNTNTAIDQSMPNLHPAPSHILLLQKKTCTISLVSTEWVILTLLRIELLPDAQIDLWLLRPGNVFMTPVGRG